VRQRPCYRRNHPIATLRKLAETGFWHLTTRIHRDSRL
jgi:hypothetical protein